MKKILFTAGLLLGTYLVSAQVPEKMSYQAVVRNTSGQLLANQNIGMKISILQGSNAGTVVYEERLTTSTNINGLATLELGTGTVLSGTFSSINWSSGNYYLKTETDPTGGSSYTITGTSQLLSVPYAMFAKTAENSSGGLSLPFSATQTNSNPLLEIINDGDGSSLSGKNTSTTSSITAVRGEVINTAPGGFSSAVRGVNNGTGGLGIGVWGSQAGSGWGVYGVTPTGLGVYGNSSGAGTGVLANSNTGTGLTATSTNGIAANISINNNGNNSNVLNASTLGNGTVINVSSSGSGSGIVSSTTSGFAVQGATNQQSSAAIIGDNTGKGESVVGRNNSDIAGAVVGRNDGGAYGIHGFIASNQSGTGVGVYGRVGINGSTGRAGRFENFNSANDKNALEAESNGLGNFSDNAQGNAASFILNNDKSIGAGVRGEVKTIFANFGAAGVFGVSSGTGGFGGLFYASNINGNSPALVAVAEGNGNGLTVNTKKAGNAVEASANGTGYAINATVPDFSSGKVAHFTNLNSSNTNAVVTIENRANSDILVLKATATPTNVARINAAGKGFFNGGTQNSGADIAEAFDVEGHTSNYEAGDILVISTKNDRAVEKSSEPYSTLVAGVYATKPGVLLTEEHIDTELVGKVPMGVIGVIPTKVSLEGGDIKRGDLLVTSSTSGVAMKADLNKIKIGQVLGKALQDYNQNGIGKIKVLVSIK